MSDTTSLENLKACKDAVETFKKISDQNVQIQKRNEDKTELYRAAHAVWVNRKKAADDANAANSSNRITEQRTWDNNFANKKRELEAQDFGQNCSSMGPANSGRCEGDFYEHRRECCNRDGWGTCWGEQKFCRRKSEAADRDARNTLGPRPSDYITQPFTEKEPLEKVGDYAHDPPVANDGNVQCCANIFKIDTGDVNNVKQSCLQQIDQSIVNAQAAPAAGLAAPAAGLAAPAAGPTQVVPAAGPTQVVPTVSLSNESEQEPEQQSNKNIIIIIIVVVILLLLISCSSSIGGLFMLNTGDTGEE